MLIKQISAQTDNHKYSKSVASKKLYTLKFGSEVSNPLIQSFMQYSIFFFFFKKRQPFEVQRSMRLFWYKQKWQNRIMVICLDFLRSLNNVHKFSSRNSKSYKFHGIIYFKHFDLFINCTLYLKSSAKVFSTTCR